MSPYDPVVPSDPYPVPDPDTGMDLFDLTHLLAVGAMWLIAVIGAVTVSLVVWKLCSPATFGRHIATPARQARWLLWALISWPRVAKACGLSTSERVTRTDSQGRSKTRTVWTHPRLLGVSLSGDCLRVSIRTRTGQTVDDLENSVPAIRDALGAHSARSTVVAPGTVRMEFVMKQHLSIVETARQPTSGAAKAVEIGRRENGSAWILRVAGLHTLTVGCSGAGKGSIFWGIAGGLAPAVKSGTVRLFAVDLKYGIEVSVGSALFTKVATTEADAARLLTMLEELLDSRGRKMAGRARSHTPSTAEPLMVLLIDELAGLTAYMTDAGLKRQVATSLSRILTKGRAVGIVVAAFMQDPRKEILPMRGLFTQTVALRLRSRDEVAMVLGDGLADAAPAHRIDPNQPGTGYIIDEDGSTVRVRANYWPDSLIRSVAYEYGLATQSYQGPAEN
ncbi:DNA segregation ATPase FtsK/SpoIIIE-like protein [Mycobacterium lentiflavum]|uniref:DNA segregation ATPase FtsK/SpoIIIE-like protein n=1 Tax=Mycobacterium lentiflavum TaxID=141349 RepID=A0A0E4H1B8_MYCLN|nr:FtsK/SpoIIIE domain-containing protein [Mycobacterium lentiflavum]CQD21020.1 DNA segregation ATPase FtsK/SpoIIIE-like protein [Mycobacterium lentiflavum]